MLPLSVPMRRLIGGELMAEWWGVESRKKRRTNELPGIRTNKFKFVSGREINKKNEWVMVFEKRERESARIRTKTTIKKRLSICYHYQRVSCEQIVKEKNQNVSLFLGCSALFSVMPFWQLGRETNFHTTGDSSFSRGLPSRDHCWHDNDCDRSKQAYSHHRKLLQTKLWEIKPR